MVFGLERDHVSRMMPSGFGTGDVNSDCGLDGTALSELVRD